MFETVKQPLLPMWAFLRRLLAHGFIATSIVGVSLTIGAAGYHWTETMGWLESFLNASMILTGMGPVDPMHTAAGKVFAIVYSLFSGVIFLTVVAVLFAPVAHRVLHRLHADAKE